MTIDVHWTARKHGVVDIDIEHVMTNSIATEEQDDDARLYIGPARDGRLLEVVAFDNGDGTHFAIHAMPLRPKYHRLLQGG